MLSSFKTLEFGQRMYVISKDKQSILFDPGYLSKDVLAEVINNIDTPIGIFLTHGHFDHLNGIPQIQSVYGDIPVFLNLLDEPLLKQNRLLQFVTKSKSKPYLLEEYLDMQSHSSKEILDKFGITRIFTPGHTLGSTCFIYERILISGDTLIRKQIGPTALPGANLKAMQETLLLLKLNDEFDTIAPGHGNFFKKLDLDWTINVS